MQMEISKYLRDTSRTIEGKQQLMMGAFAKALEIIPRQICDNAGIDATDVLNKLRMLHAQGETWAGVDVEGEGVGNSMERFVIEPSIVKINALEGACEAACLVLSVDETVTNPQSAAVRSFTLASSDLLAHTTRYDYDHSNNLGHRLLELHNKLCEVGDEDDKTMFKARRICRVG